MQPDLSPYKTELEQVIATALLIMQDSGALTWDETGNNDEYFRKYLPWLQELRMPYKVEGIRGYRLGVTWAVCQKCGEAVTVRIGVGRKYNPDFPMVVNDTVRKAVPRCVATFGCTGTPFVVTPAIPKEEEPDAGS